ncbi:hypothetical protein HDU97_009759, partial [Phlyctochytrium planicorne]
MEGGKAIDEAAGSPAKLQREKDRESERGEPSRRGRGGRTLYDYDHASSAPSSRRSDLDRSRNESPGSHRGGSSGTGRRGGRRGGGGGSGYDGGSGRGSERRDKPGGLPAPAVMDRMGSNTPIILERRQPPPTSTAAPDS